MATPYFIWDYDLTEKKIKEILREGNETERLWLTGRILTNARFEDVWDYLTIKEIVELFPKLRLRPDIQTAWERALTVWGYHV